MAELNTDVVNASTDMSDLEREVRKGEDEVEQVPQANGEDQDLLDSGSISSGKQLEEIQHEITSSASRQTELEDAQRRSWSGDAEGAQNRVDQPTAAISEAQASQAEFESVHAALIAEIADERRQLMAQRDALAADLPADLTALYDKLRDSLGGVGAAPLRGSRREGCHMQIAPTDLKVIADADADEVVRWRVSSHPVRSGN